MGPTQLGGLAQAPRTLQSQGQAGMRPREEQIQMDQSLQWAVESEGGESHRAVICVWG